MHIFRCPQTFMCKPDANVTRKNGPVVGPTILLWPNSIIYFLSGSRYTRLQTVWSLPGHSRQANKITVPAVTVTPTTLVGSLIRSSNLPHSLQRGVHVNSQEGIFSFRTWMGSVKTLAQLWSNFDRIFGLLKCWILTLLMVFAAFMNVTCY